MHKYLKGPINSIIGLVILFVVALFVWNVIVAGFLFYPDVMTRVDEFAINAPSGLKHFFIYFVPGLLPLFYLLLTVFVIPMFCVFKTIKLVNKIDIEKAITATKVFMTIKKKSKEAKGE